MSIITLIELLVHKKKASDSSEKNTELQEKSDDADSNPVTEPNSPERSLRRSTRQRKPPSEWWKASPSQKDTGVENPDIALVADESIPSSFAQATSPELINFWKPAIDKEEEAIRENGTFSIVERPPNVPVIPCRYVFQLKKDKPKVRIVAKGYKQQWGVNYSETYSPVISLTALRCFLSLVAHMDLECDAVDVITAFLNGELEDTGYMDIPEGFSDSSTAGKVYILHKALYGLKQAPRQWYAKINSFLVDELNFRNCSYEPCLSIRYMEDDVMLIVLYVDDLVIAGNECKNVDDVKAEFSRRYKMKDLGPANEFLGIQIYRHRACHSLHISQASYMSKILSRFKMENAKGCLTPMVKDPNYSPNINGSPSVFPYREAVGCLVYLMSYTRPDIAYAVCKLARFCESPSAEHQIALKRILRYIKATISKGITYYEPGTLEAKGYSDSDWAGCLETRKSTEAYVFLFGGGAVS